MSEIWKDIIWFEWKYQISNLGRVKSIIKNTRCKDKDWILRLGMNTSWYPHMVFYNKTIAIHIIVAKAFILNPKNKPQVNHKNWIKTDNRVENLEWMTQLENTRHSWKYLWRKNWKEWKIGKLCPCSKKTNQFDLQWNCIKTWDSLMDIQRELWINNANISACCRWKYKSIWWFIWKYL